jgi:hypothetical protein
MNPNPRLREIDLRDRIYKLDEAIDRLQSLGQKARLSRSGHDDVEEVITAISAAAEYFQQRLNDLRHTTRNTTPERNPPSSSTVTPIRRRKRERAS